MFIDFNSCLVMLDVRGKEGEGGREWMRGEGGREWMKGVREWEEGDKEKGINKSIN